MRNMKAYEFSKEADYEAYLVEQENRADEKREEFLIYINGRQKDALCRICEDYEDNRRCIMRQDGIYSVGGKCQRASARVKQMDIERIRTWWPWKALKVYWNPEDWQISSDGKPVCDEGFEFPNEMQALEFIRTIGLPYEFNFSKEEVK